MKLLLAQRVVDVFQNTITCIDCDLKVTDELSSDVRLFDWIRLVSTKDLMIEITGHVSAVTRLADHFRQVKNGLLPNFVKTLMLFHESIRRADPFALVRVNFTTRRLLSLREYPFKTQLPVLNDWLETGAETDRSKRLLTRPDRIAAVLISSRKPPDHCYGRDHAYGLRPRCCRLAVSKKKQPAEDSTLLNHPNPSLSPSEQHRAGRVRTQQRLPMLAA